MASFCERKYLLFGLLQMSAAIISLTTVLARSFILFLEIYNTLNKMKPGATLIAPGKCAYRD